MLNDGWAWMLNTTYGLVIAFAAMVAALVGIIKGLTWLHKWGIGKLIEMIGLRAIKEKQNIIESKIDKILNELTHNGGHSTKDFIKTVGDTVVRVESRQQAMLDNIIADGRCVFECTIFGDFQWVSKQLCYLLGRTKDELMGKGWLNCISIQYRSRVTNEFDISIDQSREFELDFEMIRRDGTSFMATMRTTKMSDHKGTLLAYFGVISIREEDKE